MNAGIKEQVIKLVEALPEEVTVDDIMGELFLRSRSIEG